MKAIEMKVNTPYRALSNSTDGTIEKGQIMWLSSNNHLNLPSEGGEGFLLEDEWKSANTVDFEVEDVSGGFCLEITQWSERLKKVV